MAKAQDVSWPPSNGLRTVNVSRQEVVLTSSGSTRIKAPAALVFATLLNVGEYGKWNTWVPKVTIEAQPCENLDVSQANKLHLGTNFTFLVIMDSSKPDKETPTQLKVTDISTPDNQSGYISKEALEREASFTADLSKVYRVAWKCEGGFASRGLKTERFHEVIVLGENECEVRTWECQAGMLSHAVKWMYKSTLQEKFALWLSDLKRYCEQNGSANMSQ